MKYLTAYVSILVFLAPTLGRSTVSARCLADKALEHMDASAQESIKRFQINDWEKRYRSYFTPEGSKAVLLERGDAGAVLSLETVETLNSLSVSPKEHHYTSVMKARLRESTGHYISDSLGIFLVNVFEAGKELTHTSQPTSQQIYEAIKNARSN